MKPSCLACGALMSSGPWARCTVCHSDKLKFLERAVETIPGKKKLERYVPAPESKVPRRVRDIVSRPTPRLDMDPWGWGEALPRGVVVSLSADAGVGKSTFLVRSLATVQGEVLYGASEEGSEVIAERFRRIGAAENMYLIHSQSMFELLDHARDLRPDVFVVDSLNKTVSIESNGQNAGLVDKLKAVGDFAKSTGATCIVICHVNGDGEMWGPNTLRHDTDINVEINEVEEGPMAGLRIITGKKNRFGATGRYAAFRHYEDGIRPSDEDVVFDEEKKSKVGLPMAREGAGLLASFPSPSAPTSFERPHTWPTEKSRDRSRRRTRRSARSVCRRWPGEPRRPRGTGKTSCKKRS